MYEALTKCWYFSLSKSKIWFTLLITYTIFKKEMTLNISMTG